jgi:transposase InsO family protein
LVSFDISDITYPVCIAFLLIKITIKQIVGGASIRVIMTLFGSDWSYLASVLDLASRQVVGWTLSKHPNAKLAQDALANAINRYKPNTNISPLH